MYQEIVNLMTSLKMQLAEAIISGNADGHYIDSLKKSIIELQNLKKFY
jgi:hypothetical protein